MLRGFRAFHAVAIATLLAAAPACASGGAVYRNPGPGSSRPMRSPAAENGYRDGYAQGRNDARSRRHADPVRASRYRSGDHDYNRRYGPRDNYKREYRQGFQQGYERGYRDVRR